MDVAVNGCVRSSIRMMLRFVPATQTIPSLQSSLQNGAARSSGSLTSEVSVSVLLAQ